MNWKHGFSAVYYATVVDPISWRDVKRFEITGGSISRSLSNLQQTADIDCVSYPRNVEQWVRIYLNAKQSGDDIVVPLFTGLATSPDRDINGRLETNSVQCYSVLKPAEDVLLQRGWYAPVGINGAELIRQLLSVSSAPVEIESSSPSLKKAIIAENGENNLSMSLKILTAIDWRITISGDGTITVKPKATEPVYKLDALSYDIVEPQLSVSSDWFKCPNIFRAVINDTIGIARDDDPKSMLSTVTRGREIWMEDTSCKLNKNETITQYARRRLKEEQSVAYTVNYDRRFLPDLNASDLLELHYPAQDIDGTFMVVNQSIELGYGARTSEEVRKVK